MTAVVILQPQFFPWIGVFDQISQANIYVHFDDVQLPRGRSFISRVQIKTPQGIQWWSAPILRGNEQKIYQVATDDSTEWRRKRLASLSASLARYRYKNDAVAIAEAAFAQGGGNLCEINIAAIEMMASYLSLKCKFIRSSTMQADGKKTDLLLNILRPLNACKYITGMGALNYLDHELFEAHGISVEYPIYSRRTYHQEHGEFTPYVSSLDAIAACGPEARSLLERRSTPWRQIVNERRGANL